MGSKVPFYTVVKMQVSISGKPSTLIYNKERTVLNQCERDIGESWLGNRLKGYFKAKVTPKKITILKEVNAREW